MKKVALFFTALLSIIYTVDAQLLTWSSQFPTYNSPITITLNDATKGNGALAGNTTGPIYVHIGVITTTSASPTAWQGAPNWLTNTTQYQATLVSGKWTFTLTPSAFAWGTNPAVTGTPLKIAILFRDATGTKVQKNTDGTDMYVPLYASSSGSYIRITQPNRVPSYKMGFDPSTYAVGVSVPVTAISSVSGDLKLSMNGTVFATATGTTITGSTTAVQGSNQIIASLNGTAFDTFYFYNPIPVVTKDLPANLKQGINYYNNCADSVTLVLYAPNKTRAMLIGDFPGSNWVGQAQYQMYRSSDGNYYWTTVHGLTSGTEYAYQYVVDDTIYIADGFAEKYLFPGSDPYINPNSYPGLRAYPSQASPSVNGTVSVLQICEPQYTWKTNGFTKPDKKNLIIYECLVRDFSRPAQPSGTYDSVGNYQAIIDSIGYFKRLGINAVQFMPLQEFSGNISWGYNPNYYFAPDKVYGTKNKLKELIDTLHRNGIAVILDVVYNHLDSYYTPFAKLYWDAANGRPASNNPWLNPTTPHAAYKFFEDVNQTSAATQYLVEKSLEHWINEYKVDGFRFDFTKGFTQTVSTNDNSAYDQSRIDNLNRYWDYLASKFNTNMPYMILEHFCVASEENVLINKGFMTWREMFSQYKESLLGTGGDKNFGDVMWNYTANGRNAPSPGLVGFMDSHDKERLVYECLQNGASSGSYNVRDLNTALARNEAAAALFFTVPGPKMIWQFDEFGYDIPRANNTDMKTPRWDYLSNANRAKLFDVYKKVISLRNANPSIFNNVPTAYNFNANSGFVKFLQIGETDINNTQITIVANFGVTAQTLPISFQKTGTWNNYLGNGAGTGINGVTGSTFILTNVSQSIVLQPGEYHIYISVPNCTPPATPTASITATPTCTTPTGTIVVTAPTGANIQYSIDGTNYTTNTTFAGLTTGTSYSVTAKDISTNCVSSAVILVIPVIPAAPAAPTVTVTQPSCVTTTGSINITAPTGANIQYSINGTTYSTTTSFSALAPNSTINVTAKNTTTGCVSTATVVTINAIPTAPVAPTITLTQPNCPTPTGTISISAPAGTGLEYSINGSTYQSGTTFSGLAPASYNVTVKNTTTGCVSISTAATINSVPTPPAAPTASVTVQPTCASPTGTIVITAPTGAGLEYSINGSAYQAAATFTGLTPATYNVIVKNTNTLCVSSATSLTVLPPPGAPATPTASITVTPTCTTPTGTIVVTAPTGANIQYSVNGTAYQTSGTFAGLTPGVTYNVTAKDVSTNCVSSSVALTIPAVPAAPATPTASVTVTPTCIVTTGTITVTAPTGANIQYSVDGVNYQSSGTFAGLTPGNNYSITARNTVTGCISSALSLSMPSIPGAPSTPTVTTTQPTCVIPSGTITITAPTGSEIQYSVNAGGYTTSTSYAGLAPASYAIIAKNTTTGCISSTVTVSVNAIPVPPSAPAATVSVQPSCSQLGTITVSSPVGSSFEYSINGSTYQSLPSFTNLSPASYNVTVKNTATVCVSPATVLIVNTPTGGPSAPSGLNTLNVTNAAATLQWSVVAGANSYTVEYKKSTAVDWIALTPTTQNTFSLIGLESNTPYEWRVKANCIIGPSSDYSLAQFSTSAFVINNIKNGLGIMVYANPVNATSKIAYIVPDNGRCNIVLYNSVGQKITLILDENKPKGQYEIAMYDFINNLSKGTYFLQIRQGGNKNITKFIKP